jgi:uncharacterized protein YkwD
VVRAARQLALLGFLACASALAQSAGIEPSAVAGRVVDLTNAFRQEEGHPPLRTNATLAATAEEFALFMARTDRYGHDADGRAPGERAERNGYAHCKLAENIAYLFRAEGFSIDMLARQLVDGWKRSPEHRRNMLDADVVDVGVAVAQSPRTQRWYAVQMFGLPRSAQLVFEFTNTSETAVTYRIGETSFDLPPRAIRRHERCLRPLVTFDWPGGQAPVTVEPRDGDRYNVVRSWWGEWRLDRAGKPSRR